MEDDDDAILLEGLEIQENPNQKKLFQKDFNEEENEQITLNKKLRELVNLKGKTQNLQKFKA